MELSQLPRHTEAEAAALIGVPHRTIRKWKEHEHWPLPAHKRSAGRQPFDNPLRYSDQHVEIIKQWRNVLSIPYRSKPKPGSAERPSVELWKVAVAQYRTLACYQAWARGH